VCVSFNTFVARLLAPTQTFAKRTFRAVDNLVWIKICTGQELLTSTLMRVLSSL